MTPLQKIKQGILDSNIQLVSEGYSDLTGETLVLVETTLVTNDIPNRNNDIFVKPESPKHDPYDIENFKMQITGQKTDGDGRKPCRSEPINVDKIKIVGNMWEDDKSIPDEGSAKINDKVKPTKRTRKNEILNSKLYTCEGEGENGMGCSNQEMLNPSLVPTGRYVCPKCISFLAKKRKI